MDYDLECQHCDVVLSGHTESPGAKFFCSPDWRQQTSPLEFLPKRIERFIDEREASLWGQLLGNAVRGNQSNPIAVADVGIMALRQRCGVEAEDARPWAPAFLDWLVSDMRDRGLFGEVTIADVKAARNVWEQRLKKWR